jgi:hypothetical protein
VLLVSITGDGVALRGESDNEGKFEQGQGEGEVAFVDCDSQGDATPAHS